MKSFARNLTLSTLATFGTAFISQTWTGPVQKVGERYRSFDKPAWAPPGWLFGPMWTSLYVLLSGATAIVASSEDERANEALALYGAQLVANGLWTPLFFKYGQYELAEVDVVAVTALMALIAQRYGRINRVAGAMVLPAVVWCGIATALNHSIRVRNR